MPLIEIKHLAPEHLPAAVELDQLCFGGIWTLEGYRRELESSNSDLLGLWERGSRGAGEQGSGGAGERGSGGEEEIKEDLTSLSSPSLIGIGCLWSILEEAHITILAIHPDYQGQGFGQALLYALLKSAHQQKLEWATLEVRSSNLVAISLYQKFGFQEAGRRRGYYQDSGEDALILWRGGIQKPEFKQDLAKWEREIRYRVSPDLLLQGV
ncbi:ribosomal protein S18-alanine N-acetyltransferase [Phormidium nigroviride]